MKELINGMLTLVPDNDPCNADNIAKYFADELPEVDSYLVPGIIRCLRERSGTVQEGNYNTKRSLLKRVMSLVTREDILRIFEWCGLHHTTVVPKHTVSFASCLFNFICKMVF